MSIISLCLYDYYKSVFVYKFMNYLCLYEYYKSVFVCMSKSVFVWVL